jgi:hypothetical protein
VAIIGHSLGAAAVSHVQGVDRRVETVVALDKLGSSERFGLTVKPKVPALAVQSEYGFNVTPYWMMGGSSLAPEPRSRRRAPTPSASRRRASTPGARPASTRCSSCQGLDPTRVHRHHVGRCPRAATART